MKFINKSKWNGFKRKDYIFNGRQVIIVFPNKRNINGWIWRTEFFGEFAYADIDMIKHGYILAYYMVSDLFGAPCAVEMMREFHKAFLKHFNIEMNPILFGFSRGGLYAFNYACKYPNEISALYLDAPVLDIKSWPGGFFSGEGDKAEWIKCIKAYGYKNISEALKYEFVDRIKILLDAKISIIIVAGDSDSVVPYKENAKILKDEYEKRGGEIQVILKEGAGHHPHSFQNPLKVVEFLTNNIKKTEVK